MSLAVVALGGNALLPKGQSASLDVQFRTSRSAMSRLVWLLQEGWDVVLTHGNGPQVGNILLQSEAAKGNTYPVTLGVAVAESEGEIGYIVQQSLHNELRRSHLPHAVVTVLTQVVVEADDHAFQHPTKPIGPYYTEQQAQPLRASGMALALIKGAGWRRVVASPKPLEIIEVSTIQRLVGKDVIVIAAGGGGIPVIREGDQLRGVDAVVDKDLASATLAKALRADRFIMLTDVPRAALRFNTSTQHDLRHVSVAQARAYLAEGHFPPGTMGPKIEAAIDFAQSQRRPAVITSPELLRQAMEEADGTIITP